MAQVLENASLPSDSLVGKRLRLVVSDERVVVGVLEALDENCNLILSEAEQDPPAGAAPDTARLHLGYVMVPGHAVKSCFLQSTG